MIRVGIIGGAGYTAGELIRLLVFHPAVQIAFVHSESHAGSPVHHVHSGLLGDTDLVFCSEYNLADIDVLFLCGGHGRSSAFWAGHPCPENLKIIDLAQDYRDESEGYVYGLPEWQRDKIKQASKIANPGCFATTIQLSLLPLAAAGLLNDPLHITAVTGSTGAGVKPSETTHFSWRTDNLSTYKVFTHQHLIEIRRTLGLVQKGFAAPLYFIPVRGDFTRGIFATLTLPCSLDADAVKQLYKDFYADAPFTWVSNRPLDLKQVVNTNKCLIHTEVHDGQLVVTAALDNLLKGASGQAVENMNLLFGLPQDCGLKLKASAF